MPVPVPVHGGFGGSVGVSSVGTCDRVGARAAAATDARVWSRTKCEIVKLSVKFVICESPTLSQIPFVTV